MKIGFLGLGNMGGRMVTRLLDAGHELIVHDLSAEACDRLVKRGARSACGAAEIAAECELVFLCLPSPAAVTQVVGQLVGGGKVGTVVDFSTSGPSNARDNAAALAAKGIDFLDAPVSGGTTGAEKGALSIMTSGKTATLERVRPYLDVLGSKIFHMGEEPGLGQAMKVVNNMLCAAATLASFEGLVLGVKLGLDPRYMLEVLNASSGRSFATQEKIPQCILDRSFPMRFTTELMLKDVALCVDEGEKLGIPMWMGSTARQYLAFAVAQGDGPKDYAHVIEHLENWAGVEFGSK